MKDYEVEVNGHVVHHRLMDRKAGGGLETYQFLVDDPALLSASTVRLRLRSTPPRPVTTLRLPTSGPCPFPDTRLGPKSFFGPRRRGVVHGLEASRVPGTSNLESRRPRWTQRQCCGSWWLWWSY